MVSKAATNWSVRGVTFLLWAAAAASVVAWGLKLSTGSGIDVPPAAGSRAAPVDTAALASVLGASGPAPVAGAAPQPSATRMSLLGVVADRSHRGAALISVDGRPPKPYRVGSPVDEGLVLKSVEGRRAVLAASMDGPAVITLDLPPLATLAAQDRQPAAAPR